MYPLILLTDTSGDVTKNNYNRTCKFEPNLPLVDAIEFS